MTTLARLGVALRVDSPPGQATFTKKLKRILNLMRATRTAQGWVQEAGLGEGSGQRGGGRGRSHSDRSCAVVQLCHKKTGVLLDFNLNGDGILKFELLSIYFLFKMLYIFNRIQKPTRYKDELTLNMRILKLNESLKILKL